MSSGAIMSSHGGTLVATDEMPGDDGLADDGLAEGMVSLLRCVGARPGHEIYFSTPITTGETFLEWRRATREHLVEEHPDYRTQHREQVIDKNLERVPPIVARLRRSYPDRLVIDPTGLDDIDGWQQSDYHRFWCAVVATYAVQVVFADGWQLSTGCVAEFATAVRFGIPTHREDLTPLPPQEGIQLVTEAVAELERVGEEPAGLRGSLLLATRYAGGAGATG